MPSRTRIREAGLKDIEALVDLENRGFRKDNFSYEQFHYLLTKANCTIFIITYQRRLAGQAVMLWRTGRKVARLYSIVVDPSIRGAGLGSKLLDACEKVALKKRYKRLSLEVRVENKGAIAFYKKHGYRILEKLPGYYAGRSSGYRMVKTLGLKLFRHVKRIIPYYAQTLDFTCGAACLMMAFKHFRGKTKLTRSLEIELWRESTSVFMTSGIGGTGPFGMALAALKRGYTAKLILSAKRTPFFTSVRARDKKAVIKIVHEDLMQKALDRGVKVEYHNFGIEDIAREMNKGRLAIVLISTYHLHGDRSPHWVLVTGFDSEFVYCHDPFEKHYLRNNLSPQDVQVTLDEFREMRRYGKYLFKCVIFLGLPKKK